MKYECGVAYPPTNKSLRAKLLVKQAFFLDLEPASKFLQGGIHLELSLYSNVEDLRKIVGDSLWVEEIQEAEFGTLEQEKLEVARAWYEKLTKSEKEFVMLLGQQQYGSTNPPACCP